MKIHELLNMLDSDNRVPILIKFKDGHWKFFYDTYEAKEFMKTRTNHELGFFRICQVDKYKNIGLKIHELS